MSLDIGCRVNIFISHIRELKERPHSNETQHTILISSYDELRDFVSDLVRMTSQLRSMQSQRYYCVISRKSDSLLLFIHHIVFDV